MKHPPLLPLGVTCICGQFVLFDIAVPVFVDGKGHVWCPKCAEPHKAKPIELDAYRHLAERED